MLYLCLFYFLFFIGTRVRSTKVADYVLLLFIFIFSSLSAPLRSKGSRLCFTSVYLFIFFFYSPFVLRNYSTDYHKIFRDCVFWCSLNNPIVLKFF